ncbi:MAG: hypothetical protein ACKVOU_14735 [Cytophagales bacterium]
MKKTLIFLFFTFLFVQKSFSQRVKYKDVYEKVKTKNFTEAYPLLKIVLKKDTSIASANLHLGSILFDRAMAYDVLKENEAAQIDCDSALYFLAKAKRQINEKEIRRNDEYYSMYTRNAKDTLKPISNKDTIFRRVVSDLDTKLRVIPNHKKQIILIFELFNKSVDLYAQSATLYKNINNKYANIKELCLLSDAQVEQDLDKIQVNYDSSLYYFEAYKKAIKAYPIKGYNQEYEIEKIETFRLDGLAKTDFLAQKLMLWNYAKWAKEIKLILNKDIKKIREGILKYDELYNNTFEEINTKFISYDSATSIKADKKLYSLVNKYDYNSMAVKLLDYKQKRLELLATSLNKYNDVDHSTGANFEPKIQFFYELAEKIRACDTSLARVEKINLAKESVKYGFYISKRFADLAGINSYLSKEKNMLKESATDQKQNYLNAMYNFHTKYTDTTAYVSNANYRIPLFPGYEFCNSSVKTTVIKEDIKGNIFVAGYIYQTNGISNAFLCKMSDSRQVLWFKNIEIKPENKSSYGEFITSIEPSNEGCIVAINSRLPSGIKNFLIRYDKNGAELFSRSVASNAVARQMIFDEINDNFILVTKGELAFDFTEKEEPLTIVCYDNTGVSKWMHKFNLKGNVTEYSKVFEGYLLLCNFVSISTGSNIIQSKAGSAIANTNIFMLKITTSGQIAKFETISSELKPVYALGSVKINSGHINILGVNGEFSNRWHFLRPSRQSDKMLSVINSNVEVQK